MTMTAKVGSFFSDIALLSQITLVTDKLNVRLSSTPLVRGPLHEDSSLSPPDMPASNTPRESAVVERKTLSVDPPLQAAIPATLTSTRSIDPIDDPVGKP